MSRLLSIAIRGTARKAMLVLALLAARRPGVHRESLRAVSPTSAPC